MTATQSRRYWRISIAAVCALVLVVIGWGYALRVLTT